MILTILSSFLATHLNLIDLSVSYKVVHPSLSLGYIRVDPQDDKSRNNQEKMHFINIFLN